MAERRILVTIFCILGWLYAAYTLFAGYFISVVSDNGILPIGEPSWYGVLLVVIGIGYIIALMKVWYMRKIGLWTYTGLQIIPHAIAFPLGFGAFPFLIASIILVGPLYYYLEKFE